MDLRDRRPFESVTRGLGYAYRRAMKADPCCYCLGPSGYLDHIHAKTHGGSDGWENRAGICNRCNSQKKEATVLAFLGWKCHRPEFLLQQQISATWRKVGDPREGD